MAYFACEFCLLVLELKICKSTRDWNLKKHVNSEMVCKDVTFNGNGFAKNRFGRNVLNTFYLSNNFIQILIKAEF